MGQLRAFAVLLGARSSGLAAPGPASASVPTAISFGRRTITLIAPAARAIISRDPFRLRIEQAGGAPVLSETNNRGRRLALAPIEDPIAPGLDDRTALILYAPLPFWSDQSTWPSIRAACGAATS